jgi:hypothetical protein
MMAMMAMMVMMAISESEKMRWMDGLVGMNGGRELQMNGTSKRERFTEL